jgi:hypothetical protein
MIELRRSAPSRTKHEFPGAFFAIRRKLCDLTLGAPIGRRSPQILGRGADVDAALTISSASLAFRGRLPCP